MLILLLCLAALISFSEAGCTSCTGYCGSDNRCYSRVPYSYISSFYYLQGSTNVTSSTTLSSVFDSSTSTSISCPTAATSCSLQLNFEAKYFVQYINLVFSTTPIVVKIHYSNCSSSNNVTTNSLTSSNVTSVFPTSLYINGICIYILKVTSINLREVYIYGLSTPPSPTNSPTLQPTPPTSSPSTSPTRSPTLQPTKAPTKHPTPDVCNEQWIRQPCCGFYNSTIVSREIDVLTHSDIIDNCTNTYVDRCCGGLAYNQYTVYSIGATAYYGCNSSTAAAGGTDSLCDISFISKTNLNYTLLGGKLKNFTTSGGIPNSCYCTYSRDVCSGTDEAACGSSSIYDKVIYPNSHYNSSKSIAQSWWNTSYWLNFTSYYNYSYLTYSPCSSDSFIGQVSQILDYSSEQIDNDTCYCDYKIQYCEPLYNYDLSSTRYNQSVETCCNGGNLTYTTDSWGYPQTWTCLNTGSTDLCPDLHNNQYSYTTNLSLHYWYENNNGIQYNCTCLYTVNRADVPTSHPTDSPTHRPTKAPSMLPTTRSPTTTKAPTPADQSHAKNWNIINTFVIIFIVFNVIQVFIF